MSVELEAAKDVVAHPASWLAAFTAIVSWLGNKLWKAHRHEISDIKQSQLSFSEAMWKAIEKRIEAEEKLAGFLREHEGHDNERYERQETASRDRHDEIMQVIGDLRADIAGLKR